MINRVKDGFVYVVSMAVIVTVGAIGVARRVVSLVRETGKAHRHVAEPRQRPNSRSDWRDFEEFRRRMLRTAEDPAKNA